MSAIQCYLANVIHKFAHKAPTYLNNWGLFFSHESTVYSILYFRGRRPDNLQIAIENVETAKKKLTLRRFSRSGGPTKPLQNVVS